MASLQTQAFYVEVFLTTSLLQPQPDVVGEVVALTSQFAVQQLMQVNGLESAAIVYTRSRYHEAWIYEVCVFPDGIEYTNPIERSL